MNPPVTTPTSEPCNLNASQLCQSGIEQTLRQGAQQMLQRAIEEEVAQYLERHRHRRDPDGHRLVVGNGHLPARDIQTGLGSVRVPRPGSRSST